jgi:hypothetical protein
LGHLSFGSKHSSGGDTQNILAQLMKLEAIVLAIVMCSNIQLMWIGE